MLAPRSLVAVFSLGLLAPRIDVVASFAISSSNSPKRKAVTNQGDAPGGFAKKSDSVPPSHARDDSAATAGLVDFLRRWKAEGLGPGSGTEVGRAAAGGRRGVYATAPFKAGDVVCRIPSDCALALTDPGAATDEPPTMAECGLNFLRWYQNDARARPLWSACLDALPTREAHFDPTPDFYSEEEIAQLQFPTIVDQTNERKRQIAALAASEAEITFDELQFATWLVASRSFAIQIRVDDPLAREGAVSTSERALRLLLPYLDLINHASDDANVELHLIDPEEDAAWFAVRARRPIKRGQELTIGYGAAGVESSLGLLLNYGFVPDQNKVDALLFRDASAGNPLFAQPEAPHWKTTVEEDEAQLLHATGNMVDVLKLRIKLKRACLSCDNKAQ